MTFYREFLKFSGRFLILFLVIFSLNLKMDVTAGPGDTTIVQAFTFGSPQNDWFLFPPDSIRFEKILMYYTLKCHPPPGVGNPAFPCGEWDYLTYSYLYEHTGKMDSNVLSHANYEVNGASPDSFKYMMQPSWVYSANWQYNIVYTSTLTFDSAKLGSGSTLSNEPFESSSSDVRAQYIWTNTELLAAGLTAGDITNLRFDIATVGDKLQHLTIKMKNTAEDSLTTDNYSSTGFTTVYSANTDFGSAGWYSFDFTQAFNWDDTKGIIIEICFSNAQSGTNNIINADNTAFSSGVISSGNDYSLEFDGKDYVEVPAAAFSNIDSFITVSFWQYGDPGIQPQSDVIFEGRDAADKRVLNVHLPWGNSNVYWDAGNDGGSYDRINKLASDANFEGQWNHWAFTKDVTTGFMEIYLNGVSWFSGTSKTRDMTGITTFKLGSAWDGGISYDGMIDEFTVWNTVLSQADIADWMYKDITASHPDYANLQVYYKFNNGTGTTITDSSPNGHDGMAMGLPEWLNNDGCLLNRNFSNTTLRPNVVLGKGTYNSYLDSTLVIDSIQMSRISIVLFGDTNSPTTPTDTLYVWPEYYNAYIYDNLGNKIDSTLVTADSTLYRMDMNYFGPAYEVVNNWEIGRYITPYGIGLDLGPDGFRWTFDVSDYRLLLYDSVHLSAGNWQELLDVKFIMIEGTPPRDIIKIENMWNGSFSLSGFSTSVVPIVMTMDSNATDFRLKTRASGHGWSNPTSCAEFCPRIHSVLVDGVTRYTWTLWNECATNAVYPQGGTWIYDRAGWCPGHIVNTYDHELTPYVTPGDTASIDYNSQFDNYGNYRFASQLISYSAPNFVNDAAVSDIISPSDYEFYLRYNPICDSPKIVIKNTGSAPLTSVKIVYGVNGGEDCYYQWYGNLPFLETEEVSLPPFNWNGYTPDQTFHALVHSPNDVKDEYGPNNTMTSHFEIPPLYPKDIIFYLRTNNAGYETSWRLRDEYGTVLYSGGSLANNTLYRDTFSLPDGCYVFELDDTDDDGIDFWANSDGIGYARFREVGGSIFKFFEPDFGKFVIDHFTVGDALGEGPDKNSCTPFSINEAGIDDLGILVYPNPTTGILLTEIDLPSRQDVEIGIYSMLGVQVYKKHIGDVLFVKEEIDLGNIAPGLYLLNIKSDLHSVSKMIILAY